MENEEDIGENGTDMGRKQKILSIIFIIILITFFINIAMIIYIKSQYEISPTLILHKEIAEDTYPNAICDGQGIIHLVWQSDRDGNWDIYHSTSESEFKKIEFTNLTKNNQDDLYPSLSLDYEGNIWLIWIKSTSEGNSICGSIINSNGTLSEQYEYILSDHTSDIKNPYLMSVDESRKLLIWISRSEEEQQIKYSIIENNQIKNIKLLCRTNNAKKVSLGTTQSGKIFAIWDNIHMGENDFHLSYFNEEDENFPKCIKIKSSTEESLNGHSASLLYRDDGSNILFYCNEKGNISSSKKLFDESSHQSIGFDEPYVFLESVTIEKSPSVIEDNDGKLYLFWSSKYNGDSEIFYCQIDYENFKSEKLIYQRGPQSLEERMKQDIKNITLDPSQNNSNPEGYFSFDIFFSVSVIKDTLWIVWDSYEYDYTEQNNRRRIYCTKTQDGELWQAPKTLIDSKNSNKIGKDDRHPVLVGTKNGYLWLFWHSDRYRTSDNENYEICYIKSKDNGNTWKWQKINEDPFLLTENSLKDLNPDISSIDNEIYVVWQSDRRFGDFDIYLKEYDGKEWSDERNISNEDIPEINPTIATHKGFFSNKNVFYAWESEKEDRYLIYYSFIQKENETNTISAGLYTSTRFPNTTFIDGDPWIVRQYRKLGSNPVNIIINSSSSIFSNELSDEMIITDDFSQNERPQVIEFKGKIWVFWDSNGGGNGRGIYYKFISRQSLPNWPVYIMTGLLALLFIFVSFIKFRILSFFIVDYSIKITDFFNRHRNISNFITALIVSIIGIVFTLFFI
jgi:hypothetical protein